MIPSIRHLTKKRVLVGSSQNTQALAKGEKLSRHNRPASSWGESEQEIQDISFALIALQEVGPAVKRPGCRVRAVSSREVSLLAVGGARVWRKEERGAALEIRDEVQESCPR